MRNEYILKLLEKDERLDGRALAEFRPVKIETGIIRKAEGSARVILGKTELIAGIKMELGTPFSDMPDQGTLKTGVEFAPIAHPDFEPGPPREEATELARIVDRGIRESECIELEKLIIAEGEKCFEAYVDVHIINHDGNLIDASSLAAIAALMNARIPKLENDKIVRNEFSGKLSIKHKPITVTVGKIIGKLLLDPTKEEEDIFDSKLSIGSVDDGKVCAMQKMSRGSLDEKDVDDMINIAVKKSKELRKLL